MTATKASEPPDAPNAPDGPNKTATSMMPTGELADGLADQRCDQPSERRPERSIRIDLQLGPLDAQQRATVPPAPELERWALAALGPELSPRHAQIHWPAELTIRITDDAEIAELNQQYRSRSGATNILSFPFEPPPGIDPTEPAFAEMGALLGDLVICAPLVQREAAEQGKTTTAHWAHLVVHGALHLLGFDHLTDAEAAPMETLEIRILGALGFPSPYEVNDDANGERRRI
ncbi:rRNA maturation RNase YbeY [Halochromatium sp.]